jgi:hypothetical protein
MVWRRFHLSLWLEFAGRFVDDGAVWSQATLTSGAAFSK